MDKPQKCGEIPNFRCRLGRKNPLSLNNQSGGTAENTKRFLRYNSDRQREVVWRRRHFCCSPRVSSEFSGELTSWLKFASVCKVEARFWTSQNEGNLDSSSLLLGSINGPCEKGESCCRVFGLVWMKGSLCFEWTWFLIVFSDFLPTNFDFLPRF